MTHAKVILLGALLLGGCNQTRTGNANRPSPFDKRWDSLQQQGAQAIRVGDDPGAALMDNVLGAQAGALAASPWMAESMKGGGHAGLLPDRPDSNDVQKLVRQYVPGVKACYQRMTRAGDTRTGKAIVSFQIGSNGHVEGLTIDAPDFKDSPLPTCIDGQVSHWVFPPSRKGLTASSYPFVFSGG